MIKSVAKHSYIKGRNGIARGRAHINYVSHRDGPDREKGGRKFFDKEREDISASEIKKLMYERADSRGVTMHKIILSPGVNTDAKEYTRELVERLEREKGLKFEWGAVVHENTNHQHVHLLVMGKDAEGHLVKIDREDHKKLRQFGDEYLDREHKLDRYLDREMHDLVRSKDYDRGVDREVRRIIFGNKDERDRTNDPERDRRDFDELDKQYRQMFEDKRTPDLYPVRGRERVFEQAGRLAEHHGDYTRALERERLDSILKESPELSESIRAELDGLKEAARENRLHEGRDLELERILGFDLSSRDKSRQIEQQNMGQEVVAESFEIDRIAKPEKQDTEQELEREREDDQGSET